MCEKRLDARVGQNFLNALSEKEKIRVIRHLSLYAPDTPILSHVETTAIGSIRWVNKAVFQNGFVVEFEGIGVMHQERKKRGG